MRVNPAKRLDRIESTLTEGIAREAARRRAEGPRTPCHAMLHELHTAGYEPADAFERRVLTAYEMARDYLEVGSAWRVAADQRATRGYVAPVFFASLGRDGGRFPGWAEWDELVLGWSWPALTAVMEGHERERCCDWLLLVFVQDDDGSHVILDFHGPTPDTVPLVPRPGSPRLDVAALRMRAARDSSFGSGFAPWVDGGGELNPGQPEALAKRLATDRRVTVFGALDEAAALELARELVDTLTAEAWAAHAAKGAA